MSLVIFCRGDLKEEARRKPLKAIDAHDLDSYNYQVWLKSDVSVILDPDEFKGMFNDDEVLSRSELTSFIEDNLK